MSVQRRSLVEGEHPVPDTAPPSTNGCYTPEASVMLKGPFHNVLMGTITERGVRTELAIAQLVITTFSHIEVHRSASCYYPLALTIAEWSDLGVTTSTPLVDLASVKVHVGREKTGISWHAWWSVSALLVRSVLFEVHHLLLWEVRHILH